MCEWRVSGILCVQCAEEPYTRSHTRLISDTPSAPICLIAPWAVQYAPVVTTPSLIHRILRIPPEDCTMSNTRRENCDMAEIRLRARWYKKCGMDHVYVSGSLQ